MRAAVAEELADPPYRPRGHAEVQQPLVQRQPPDAVEVAAEVDADHQRVLLLGETVRHVLRDAKYLLRRRAPPAEAGLLRWEGSAVLEEVLEA